MQSACHGKLANIVEPTLEIISHGRFTPVDIAARTGHESIKVLMDYSHIFPNKQLDMADKLDKEGEYSESTEISKL